MKIQEIIVVEGKHDSSRLKSFFDCDTIETGGTSLDKAKLDMIQKAQQTRGVIIFTDPDAPGEKIRNEINQTVKGCKNAFIQANDARYKRKVGVEHADQATLEASLSHLMTYRDDLSETLSYDEFIDFGFTGFENSAKLRALVGEVLFIGKPNAKTLFKRLNMLQLSKEDVEQLLEEYI